MVRFECSKHKPTHTLNEFEFLQDPKDKNSKLGTGSFATVKLAKDKKTGKLYALKMIDTGHFRFSKTDLENLKTEIEIHKSLDHPNIIKYHGYIQQDNFIYLVLDYAENGNLYTYLHKKKVLTEKEIFRYFHQTCLALHYLHQNNIVHRDIKPENLLLDKDFNIKICDFGWSAYDIQQSRNTFCGTYEYMAPEIVHKKTYDYRVDIWAVGILLYELIHNKAPYKGRSLNEIKNSLTHNQLAFHPDINPGAKVLIENILKERPANRILLKQILTDPWINNHLEKEENFRRTVYLEAINCANQQNDFESNELKNLDEKSEEAPSPFALFTQALKQIFNPDTPPKEKLESKPLQKAHSLPENHPTAANSRKISEDDKEEVAASSTKTNMTPKKKKKIFDEVVLTPRFQNRLNKVFKNMRSKKSKFSPKPESPSDSTANSVREVNMSHKVSSTPNASADSPTNNLQKVNDGSPIGNSSIQANMPLEGEYSFPKKESFIFKKNPPVKYLRTASNIENLSEDRKEEIATSFANENKFRVAPLPLLQRHANSCQEPTKRKIFGDTNRFTDKNIIGLQKQVFKIGDGVGPSNFKKEDSYSNNLKNKENINGLVPRGQNL